MGSLLQNTIFGKKKHKVNTFIGGVAATLNTPALIAAKLGLPITRIKSFGIIGDDIQFAVTGGNYAIPASTFANNSTITYYHDLDGIVSSIGASCFVGCINLYGAQFKNWIATTGSNTFSGCIKLNSTDFSNLKALNHSGTFRGCILLQTNSFNWNSLTVIGAESFSGCKGLIGSIVLDLLGTLWNHSFRDCTGITSITANNITTISYGTFRGMTSLTYFQADNVTNIESITTNGQTFQNVPCTNYNFPKLVSLGDSAFESNIYVQSFIAPLLTSFGKRCFYNATGLTNCYTPKISSMGYGTYQNCINLPSFSDDHFDNVVYLSDTTFSNCASVNFTKVRLKNVTTAGATPFNGSNIKNVDLPALKNASGMGLLFSNRNIQTLEISNVESLGSDFINGFGNYIVPLSVINIPKCISFGNPAVYKNMFVRTRPGIVINVNIALQTANAGAPDADLVWVIANKGAIVNYIP